MLRAGSVVTMPLPLSATSPRRVIVTRHGVEGPARLICFYLDINIMHALIHGIAVAYS
jgi:hypothetical protein